MTKFYTLLRADDSTTGLLFRFTSTDENGMEFDRLDEKNDWVESKLLRSVLGFGGNDNFEEVTPDEAQKLAGDGVEIFPDVGSEQGARP